MGGSTNRTAATVETIGVGYDLELDYSLRGERSVPHSQSRVHAAHTVDNE
jgi:hypothetical protein